MGDAVAEAVLAQFAALPKTGKPQAHEHTVLAGIALSLPPPALSGSSDAPIMPPTAPSTDNATLGKQVAQQPAGGQAAAGGRGSRQQPAGGQLAVAALATGTKCLGASRRLPGGGAVNDCHAEALCRRALLRWLYSEMRLVVDRCNQALRSDVSATVSLAAAASAASTRVLQLVPPRPVEAGGGASAAVAASDLFGGWRFRLQPRLQLHLYISQPPCGDASILDTLCHPDGRQQAGAAAADSAASAAAAGSSFGRTGAKPLKRPRVGGGQDGLAPAPPALPQQHEVEPYAAAQAAGVVRRKPGRGDPTLSMSCSDKLARWCLLGLQVRAAAPHGL